MSRLFVSRPLVAALGIAFSGWAQAADSWEGTESLFSCPQPDSAAAVSEPPQAAAVDAESAPGAEPLPQDTVRIRADKAVGQTGEYHRAEGSAVLERNDETLHAQWVDYDQKTGIVEAGDTFTLTRADGQTVSGEKLHYDVQQGSGQAQNAEFAAQQNGRRLQGVGKQVQMENKQRYQVDDVKFNTCNSGDHSWYIQAASLTADQTSGIGVAKHARLVFGGVPVLYTPWADFPINGSRKSGFLVPTVSGGSNGTTVEVPYYFNLAPNYDATLTLGGVSGRGAKAGGEVRYLQPRYSGTINADYMPHDNERKRNHRYWLDARHRQQPSSKLSGGIDFNQVSDDNYYQDFFGRDAIAESINLNRSAWLNYHDQIGGGSLNAGLLVQKYQTLSDSNGYKDEPYAILPRLAAQWQRNAGNGLFDINAQFTRFHHDSRQSGSRTLLYPSLKWDFHNAWGYIRPKLGVHITHYRLDQFGSLKRRNVSRVLPIANADAGITFERNTDLAGLFGGKRFVQTLEPRLFYNYIPAKSQNDLPNFDASENHFGYDQLFRENIYSGNDRINASNSLSAGVQSRILDGQTGEEYFRAGVGQKHYFNNDNVLLDGSISTAARSRSDLVAFGGGRVARHWWADAFWHWSENDRRLHRFDSGVRYTPAAGKTVSVRFKYGRNEEIYSGFFSKLKHIDIGAQWRLRDNLYAVGRLNYSISPRTLLEQTLGLEYKSPCGCWSVSVAGQRYVSSLNKHKTSYFITLQLKDLSNLGRNLYSDLRLGIPGYTPTNEVYSK